MSKVIIVNQQSGEIIEREMNAEELAQKEEQRQKNILKAQSKAEAETAKAAATAKLAALGLTADDLTALGL